MTIPSSILQAPIWPDIKPFFEVEIYSKDGKGRRRVEIKYIPDDELRKEAFDMVVSCPKCSEPHHPVRHREGAEKDMYFAASCPLEINYRCARSKVTSAEYNRVAEAVMAM